MRAALAEKGMEPVSAQKGLQLSKDIGAVNYLECSALLQKGLKVRRTPLRRACARVASRTWIFTNMSACVRVCARLVLAGGLRGGDPRRAQATGPEEEEQGLRHDVSRRGSERRDSFAYFLCVSVVGSFNLWSVACALFELLRSRR